MNYEIETDSKRKEPIFNKEHANIQIRMAATNLTNDILIPIIEDKIENQDSAIVFVQKKENLS